MKLLKWLSITLVALLLLAALAVGLVMLLLDTGQIKQQLVSRFEQQTGHSLQIDAPLEWTLFPWLGLRLENVVVGNAPGFGDQPLATVRELDVKVGLMPLLDKRIAVDTVLLKGVLLNLQKNAEGQGNWESLAGSDGKKGDGRQVQQPETGEKPAAMSDFQVHLKGIEIENLDLHYLDQAQGKSYRLQDLELSVGEVVPGQPVMVRLGAGLDLQDPAIVLKLQGSTELTASADYQRIDLSALAIDLEAGGEGLPQKGLKMKLAGDVALDLAVGKLAIGDLSLSGPQVDMTGAVSIAGLNDKPRVEGRLALQDTNLRALLGLFGVEPDLADAEALTRVSMQMQMRQDDQSLKIEPLQIQLDDTRIEGVVSFPSFEGPVIRARLKLDAIDLDRYLPANSESGEKTGSGSRTRAQAVQKKVDFTPLRRLDADIVVEAARLEVSNLKMEQVRLTLKAKKGVISLDPVTALLYRGRLNASTRLDVRKERPSIQVSSKLAGIQVGPLLADLTGEERLTGTGNVEINLRTRGMDPLAARRNLHGKLAIDFRDGAYKGFNLAHAIRQAEAALRGAVIEDNEPQQTDFAELRGTGTIRKGVLTNRDLYLASPVLRVKGKGKVDLVAEEVDYRIAAKVVGTLVGQGGRHIDELKGVTVPVRVKGKLDDPSFTVDAEALARALAEEQLEEHKGKLIEKIEEKLGPGLLEGLLGR